VFGGVVPEIASRAHLTSIVPVVDRALAEAGTSLDDLDAIAVTNTPGLVGALLVGVSYGKALAFSRDIPLLGVHHMEGHLFAAALEHRDAVPPFTALLISGDTPCCSMSRRGNTVCSAPARRRRRRSFRQVAKLLGLPYRAGGIEELAATESEALPIRGRWCARTRLPPMRIVRVLVQRHQDGVLNAVRDSTSIGTDKAHRAVPGFTD
jgi:N6-L-threonylcarbamoyladenine synthase